MASLDVVVTGFGAGSPDPDLDERVLAEDDLCGRRCGCVTLGGARNIHLSELDDYPWVVASNIAEVVPGWARAFTDQGLTPPKPTIASDSYLFIKSVLGEGDFVAVLPRDVISAAESSDAFSVSRD